LSVFFDASGTTATSTALPFHDLEYRWAFGDPAGSPVSGTTWNNGSRAGVSSRNSATGPVASHVYEMPGVYTVALSATDGTNTVSNSCAQIVVQDPETVFAGANTICFSGSGNFTGCPAGATHSTTSNFVTAISFQATGRRLLFRRGETFTAASPARINSTGPGIVGAFGTGTLPSVQMAGNNTILLLSSNSTPGIKDWRVMDLDFDGLFKIPANPVAAIEAEGGFNQFLALRLNIHDIWRGVSAPISILDYENSDGNPAHSGHTVFEEWAIVDSTMTAIPGCNSTANVCDWRIYLAGKRNTIQGNSLDNNTNGGSHTIRSEYTAKGVFSNNTIARAGATQGALKLHAMRWTQASVANPGAVGTYTEKVVISDNKLIGANNPWTFSIGPQNAVRDERVKDIIVERNWFVAGPGTQVHIHLDSVDSTIRNNICDMSGAAYHQCVEVTQWGVEPPPTNDRVYNNTFYSSTSGDFIGVNIAPVATNITVINNLGSAPMASGPTMTLGTGASGFIQSNNLLNNTPSALFVSATPSTPADFTLKSLPNPARDTGLSTVPIYSDFFLMSRTQNSVIDIGAIQGP
jgi:hypothetical protein